MFVTVLGRVTNCNRQRQTYYLLYASELLELPICCSVGLIFHQLKCSLSDDSTKETAPLSLISHQREIGRGWGIHCIFVSPPCPTSLPLHTTCEYGHRCTCACLDCLLACFVCIQGRWLTSWKTCLNK